MPWSATVVEGAITPEQKQQLITSLTDAVTSVYGENLRPYTWCCSTRSRAASGASAGTP
jgi:4-oxalocrotonate tautomerase